MEIKVKNHDIILNDLEMIIIKYWHGRHFFLLERGIASELWRHIGVRDEVILVGMEVLLHQGQHHLEGNNNDSWLDANTSMND